MAKYIKNEDGEGMLTSEQAKELIAAYGDTVFQWMVDNGYMWSICTHEGFGWLLDKGYLETIIDIGMGVRMANNAIHLMILHGGATWLAEHGYITGLLKHHPDGRQWLAANDYVQELADVNEYKWLQENGFNDHTMGKLCEEHNIIFT
jgi:hypothetical protein